MDIKMEQHFIKWREIYFNLKIEVNVFKSVGNYVASVDLNVILTELFLHGNTWFSNYFF